ncbi:MAG: hypothetical protein H5T84_03170 [Thermoleophilia bacterium]|nr:hypothetical protein [Thermoleophilia bacterium]
MTEETVVPLEDGWADSEVEPAEVAVPCPEESPKETSEADVVPSDSAVPGRTAVWVELASDNAGPLLPEPDPAAPALQPLRPAAAPATRRAATAATTTTGRR